MCQQIRYHPPQALSLPSGPGSIEGLGESFEPQLNTGSSSYSVKIEVPPGINSHQPDLAIQYNSGLGNSTLGLAWTLSLPSIQRQTDKGQPEYNDSDVFIFSNGEELVPLNDGSWRCENESQFMRFKRKGEGWIVHDKSGRQYQFGMYPKKNAPWKNSRTGPDNMNFSSTFKWYLDSFTDTNGNTIEYHYTSFPDAPGLLFISDIQYGGQHNIIRFVYEKRPDIFCDYRAGFKIRTSRRLSSIRIFSLNQLIREYRFSYDSENTEIQDPSANGSISIGFSLITKITQFDGSGKNFLPPIRFGYTRLFFNHNDSTVHEIKNAPQHINFQDHNSDFVDINGDALPDILRTTEENYYYYLNKGKNRFGIQRIMKNAPKHCLSSNHTMLVDIDGDGLTDLINKSHISNICSFYRNLGDGSWAYGIGYKGELSLAESGYRLLDVDFDKKIDIVQTHNNQWRVYYNRFENKTWQCVAKDYKPLFPQITFNNPAVHMADMNGDRLQDIVWMKKVSSDKFVIWYWPNKGQMQFDQYIVMTGESISGYHALDDFKFSDVNSDGLSDLIRIQNGSVAIWINSGDKWHQKHQFFNTPEYAHKPYEIIRFTDMNGNGTNDLVWIKAIGDGTQRFQYLDFCGDTLPNQLKIIDNGLGQRINIHYKSSTAYSIEANDSGNPWKSHSPVAVQVVSKVVTTSGLDLDGVNGKDSTIIEYSYKDPYYDGFEKEFRGFSQVTKTEKGDKTIPDLISLIHFHTGAPDNIDNDNDFTIDERTQKGGNEEESLKGKMLSTEIIDSKGKLYKRIQHHWKLKRLHKHSLDEREVSFAWNQQEDTYIIESDPDHSKHIQNIFLFDEYGNVIFEKNMGALSISGDEIFTVKEFIINTDLWIIDKVKKELIYDADNTKLSEQRMYYDGDDFLGMAFGAVEKGNMKRKGVWIKQNVFIDETRNAFDQYGNIIAIKDGNNNLRTIEFDQYHTFPVKESIHVNSDTILYASALYNVRFGKMIRSEDFNGAITEYAYDSFGRLTKIIQPGDTIELPTQQFRYTMVDPERYLIYHYNCDGELNLTFGNQLASSVLTQKRKNSGETDTFDSIAYYDGMKRKLAEIDEDEDGYIVKNAVIYNARNTAYCRFLPYRYSLSDYHVPNSSYDKEEIFYDGLKREILTKHPPDQYGKQSSVQITYYPLKKMIIDENQKTKSLLYDAQDRLIEVHEHNRQDTYITRYDYDANNNLIQLIDSQNNTKTMHYDGMKRKVLMEDPDKGTMEYVYDNAGNILQTKDNNSNVIVYTYDGANRIVSEDYIDSNNITPDISYYYDTPSEQYPEMKNTKGALSWIKDLSGSIYYSYDLRKNIIQSIKIVHSNAYKTVTQYDSMGRVIHKTYPDNSQIRYQYNNRSLLESIEGIIGDIDYHPSGKIAHIAYANRVKTDYTYDPRHRLIQLKSHNTLSDKKLQDLRYSLDGVGNILAIEDKHSYTKNEFESASQIFQYDDLYRLKAAQGKGYSSINYQYDKIGNMIDKRSPVTNLQTIDPLNNPGKMLYGGHSGSSGRSTKKKGDQPGPHAITSSDSGLSYDYDDNGNMLRNNNDIYSWDSKNRLISITKPDLKTIYTYDFEGNRTSKIVSDNTGEKTQTLYISKDFEIRNHQAIRYIFVGNKRLARIDSQTQYQTLFFAKGWNFFSLTVEPDNCEILSVLKPVQNYFTEIWEYDSKKQMYKGYVPEKGIHQLTELHTNKGYIIHMKDAASIQFRGKQASHKINLSAGWNLTGSLSAQQINIRDMNNEHKAHIQSIWSYDTVNDKWNTFVVNHPDFLNELQEITPGKAYWVEMKNDAVIHDNQQPTNIYYYLSDHLGSTNVITKSDGSVVKRIEYYPYGKIRLESNDNFDSLYSYTGKEFDQESGLIYFGARYYDPSAGRFISVDPLGENMPDKWLFDTNNLNLYIYVLNNPINWIDPLGLDRYVIVVGDQGIGEHNVGSNFLRTAQTREEQLSKSGHKAEVSRISNVSEFNTAITSGSKIDGGVIYYGHGWEGILYIGETSDSGTNLNSSNIKSLSNSNLAKSATIELNSCNSGTGGNSSIAQLVANSLNRDTSGWNRPLGFTDKPGVYLHGDHTKPPETGPLYIAPTPGGIMIPYKSKE